MVFHPSNLPHNIPVRWDLPLFSVPAPRQRSAPPRPLPARPAEQTPLPGARKLPGESRKTNQGPLLLKHKLPSLYSQRKLGKEFGFHLYLRFLGLLFCYTGEAESKSSSGAAALL